MSVELALAYSGLPLLERLRTDAHSPEERGVHGDSIVELLVRQQFRA